MSVSIYKKINIEKHFVSKPSEKYTKQVDTI